MDRTFIFEYSPWLIFICLFIAFGYAFFLYFRDKKLTELSKKKVFLFAVIRFLSSFIISLLLLSPLLKTFNRTSEEPLIIFAVDNTESIKLAYNKNDELLSDIKENLNSTINSIQEDFKTEIFSFGKELKDTLIYDYTEKQTDISNIISEASNKFYNKNIGALVIISDGLYNKGTNPVYSIKNTNFSIYTAALGDTTVYKDLLIKDVRHNEIAFKDNRFPLIVTIAAKKLKSKNAVCNIYHNNKKIASKNFTINSNDYLEKLNFNIEANKAGVQQYRVSVTNLKEEKNIVNNTKIIAINVIENRQKILFLANSPHPDIGAIFNSLKQNANFDIDIFSGKKFNKEITDYSLVILHQLPSFSNNLSQLLPKLINSQIPVFFILGTQTNYNVFNSYNFGVQIQHRNSAFDEVNGYVNSNFNDFEISEKFSELLKTATPLLVPFGDYKTPPQMENILLQDLRNIKTSKPLISISNYSSSLKSGIGIIFGENIWRLRMHCFKKYNDFKVFDNFINQIIQSLVLKINRNRFIVKVDKIIPENKEILFKAEVYNKIFELTNKNDVDLKITDSTGNTYNYKLNKSENSYFLNIGNLPEGSYSYFAKTKQSDKTLTKSGSFTVIKSNIESLNLVADYNLLLKLANKTGGKFIKNYTNIDSLKNYLAKDENITPISYETQDLSEFIKFKWIFFLILALLTLEWFLRKISGTY